MTDELKQSAPAESEPVATDVLYEYYLQAVDNARRSYASYKASVHGQQLSPLDEPQYHLFVEAYKLFHVPASPAQPPNVQAQIAELQAEIEGLRKALHDNNANYQMETSDLACDLHATRKDAERYRWLRDEDNWGEDSGNDWGALGGLSHADFDTAIDTALHVKENK